MTLDDFANYINVIFGERPECLRLGQYAFNILNESHPDIANSIRASDVDPFYRDSRLIAFMIFILRNFVEKPVDSRKSL